MYKFPIGVMLESFHKPAAEAMDAARALGAQGLQVYATPTALEQKGITTPAAQKEFFKMVKDHGLVISALCGDLGHGFASPEKNPQLIEDSKRILDLAKAIAPEAKIKIIGIRPGEKLHEVMCPSDLYYETVEFPDHFVIKPSIEFTEKIDYTTNALGEHGYMVEDGFDYNSGNNPHFLTVEELKAMNP